MQQCWCLLAIAATALLTGPAAGVGLRRAAVPDPSCHTGVVSLPVNGTGPLVCCAGYCGECSDYPTCGSVRGQDSENACCASKVYGMRCGEAPANVCLKSCADSVPPCIMPDDAIVMPSTGRHAGDDCNEAISKWRRMADAATSGAAFLAIPEHCRHLVNQTAGVNLHNQTAVTKINKTKLDNNQIVYVDNAPVLGAGSGEAQLNQCSSLADNANSIKVCGTGIQLKTFLRNRCVDYYEHQQVVGQCNSGDPADTCQSLALTHTVGEHQSYVITQCR